MNKNLDIKRVEFSITEQCTSRCIHCSNTYTKTGTHISPEKGIHILKKVAEEYSLDSVMAFGGEPLLYPESTIGILDYAKEINIPRRHIITNGFWSRNKSKIDEICAMLEKAEVNDIMVSIDGFHHEHLDYDIVEYTVSKLNSKNLDSIRLHPCWYKSESDDNEYDEKTRQCLSSFSKYNIEVSKGNILFPAGNAITNFPGRFSPLHDLSQIDCGILPYTESPDLITSIGIDPHGKVSSLCFGDDIEIDDFLENYDPYSDTMMNIILTKGINELVKIAQDKEIDFHVSDYYSMCDACNTLRKI